MPVKAQNDGFPNVSMAIPLHNAPHHQASQALFKLCW